jgi:serine phosphatase RsbU (regulator of sigma subunit)
MSTIRKEVFNVKSIRFNLSLLLVFFLNTVQAQFSRSDESMALSLYTIIQNTSWENQATFTNFQIGVLDQDSSFYLLISSKYQGVTLKGKKAQVILFKSIDGIKPTQVLYVDKGFNKKMERVAQAIEGNNTLLVTNASKKNELIMVNFNGRLKKDDFTIHRDNMAKAGLKVNDQFEQYMDGTVAWETLLQASNEKLEEAQEKVAAKDQEIKSQKVKLNVQKMTLQEKIDLLDKQSSLLEEQQQTLDSQEAAISEREQTLLDQQNRIQKQKERINQQMEALGMQRILLILVVIVLALILGIAVISIKNSKERKKSMLELSEQHAIVTSQKEQIEQILIELTDSIHYALRIQNAVLPNEQKIKSIIPGDHFVLYKPKDIVSGDFYFVDYRDGWTLIAVADCTGHGVPGAFVSMLCISLLNEIIKQQKELHTDIILNELRDKVIHSLQQKGIQGEQMDGMDISLLLINQKDYSCQWSGANNPLYVVRAKDNQLEEIKPDKRPIAIYPDMGAFTKHELKASKGDVFYLFTDGYSDQFGGEKGKKFMSKNLKLLLAKNAHKTMSEQRSILNTTFENWKKGEGYEAEQVDDITVLGVRIG